MTKKITTFFQNFNALEKIILLFLFIVFCWFQKEHFFLDFWNDEIYTLKHFVFVPLSTTLSDYHVPNNHIFFNFLNNIYLKVCGVDNLYDLMDNPPLIRILPFLYSVGTLFYAYA
ncbi:MAG TPA: hypothetical protein ENJ53_00745, partial [Phaeodactylibacter sp.]|nr:hypothetical protein [Phaeodactylibacter sp.]